MTRTRTIRAPRPTIAKMVAEGAPIPVASPINTAALVLPFDMIDVDQTRNVRAYKGVDGKFHADVKATEDLVASIRRRGLEAPVKVGPVDPKTGKYPLIFGFRRMAAIQKIIREDKVKDFQVQVVLGTADRMSQDLSNLTENLVRRDLTPAQKAFGLSRMKATHKWTIKQICEELGKDDSGAVLPGMSNSNVGNLIRAYDGLSPMALEAWYKETLTVEGAIKICTFSHKEQDAMLKSVLGKDGADLEGAIADFEAIASGGTPVVRNTTPAPGVDRPGPRTVAKAAQWITSEKKLTPSERDAALRVLNWIMTGGKLKLSSATFEVESFDRKVAEEKKAKKAAEKAKAKAEAEKVKADAEKAKAAKGKN